MIGDLGWQELLIILVIIALLFGAGRVADMGGALGRGIREFREGAKADLAPGDSSGALNTDAAETLRTLATLRDQHVLTEDEFQQKRQQLIEKL